MNTAASALWTLVIVGSLFLCGLSHATEDIVLRTRVEPVDVEILIPKESRPVQGVLVHVFNYKMKQHDRWATLCRELKWVHINTIISRKENNRPTKIRHAINEALKQFAAQADLPELVHVPRTGTGFSAGGMAVNVLEESPDQMLTNAISCSWVRDPAKMGVAANIPELFIIGAVPDAFKMLPAIEKFYVPAIADKRPWALGLQHECKHDWANSGTLSVAWIQAIAKMRYPESVDPSRPIPLRDVPFAEGWRGDRTTINGTYATVAAAKDFDASADATTWLPDRATAFVWRAWQSKASPVDLSVQTLDGTQKLGPFQPKKSFGMTVRPGTQLTLSINSVDSRSSVDLRRVQFYHGDKLLGEATEAPWQVQWTSARMGCFAIWAQYETADGLAACNPALICFEPLE